MKTHHQIQSEIETSQQLPKFDRHPAITECWNEYEQLWRDDNGRSYIHWVEDRQYEYHLMYFDGRLAIAERNGVTIFSHLTERLERSMKDREAATVSNNYDAISLDELVKLSKKTIPPNILG
jgi:hypothetical protein